MSGFFISPKSYFLTLLLVGGPSIFVFYLGIPYSALYLASFLALIAANHKESYNKSVLSIGAVSAIIAITSAVGAIYWGGDLMYAMPAILCTLMFTAVASISNTTIENSIRTFSSVILVVLIGAWIGLLLALVGIDALLTFSNPDGRTAGLFSTTLSNTIFRVDESIIIRPSGIYDEPGALSFFTIAAAFLCELSRSLKNRAWLLLILGLVTTSLAHLIFLVLFSIYKANKRFRPALLGVIALSATALGWIANEYEPTSDKATYISRLTISRIASTEDGLEGDNRTTLIKNAISKLEATNFFFGLDSRCVSAVFECKNEHGNFGENPLSPLISGGFAGIGGLYAAGIACLAIAGWISKKPLLFFAIFLVFLQRPYLFISPQYTLPIALSFSLIFNNHTTPRKAEIQQNIPTQ